MLLEFKTKNYKSFKEELVFSLIPAPKQKDLEYSILQKKIDNKNYKALSTAVIYGANASGKTNIIGAMDTFKKILLRGNINNSEDIKTNIAAEKLELIPNNTLSKKEPVHFYIKFIEENFLIEYELVIDLGLFWDSTYKRKILKENLNINEKNIFTREKTLEVKNLELLEGYLINEFDKNKESAIALAKNNLNDIELFLMNGFKSMISGKFVEIISNWLDKKFKVIHRADTLKVVQKFDETKKEDTFYIDKLLNQVAKLFGINSNDLGYVGNKKEENMKLCSGFKDKNGKRRVISAEDFESYGTIRFINMFPLIANALLSGGVLIIDEFDASIHPKALMNIINIFHNDEINKNKAQLIFNTHNPIFLNKNLFRRDEIKFVERDEDNNFSTHYSLSDFGTAGENGVRKTDDYMKNYFIERYGAIRDIDFSHILEELIKKEV